MWPSSRTPPPGAGSSPYGADSSKQGGQNRRNRVLVYIFTSRRSREAADEAARWGVLWLNKQDSSDYKCMGASCRGDEGRGGRKRRQWQREWSMAGRQTGKIWWSGHLTPCFYKAAHVLIEANHVDQSYRWHRRASRCQYKRVCVHVL